MALWGNTDLVYSDGTISVNFDTKTAEGVSGVVTFTSAVSEGDFLTVGAGATFGYAAIIGVTSTTLLLASVDGFVAGITTVEAGAHMQYHKNQFIRLVMLFMWHLKQRLHLVDQKQQ